MTTEYKLKIFEYLSKCDKIILRSFLKVKGNKTTLKGKNSDNSNGINSKIWSSYEERRVNALASVADEGRDKLR